jgi:hypothetical protein
MEDEVPPLEFDETGEPILDGGDSGDHQVRIERFYDDDGELQGLQITCRCGEVIDLEFTREEDEELPETVEAPADVPTAAEAVAEEPSEFTEGLDLDVPMDKTEAEQESQTVDQPAEPELEPELEAGENIPEQDQISMDNGEENIEIEET